MAKGRIIQRAMYAGMLAAKRCALTETPVNPYKSHPKYGPAFEAGVRRMRNTGTLKVQPSRRVP